jgi:hypothetical protein
MLKKKSSRKWKRRKQINNRFGEMLIEEREKKKPWEKGLFVSNISCDYQTFNCLNCRFGTGG